MKTIKQVSINFEKVKHIPENVSPNVVYISDEYEGCLHLCLCGCGQKQLLPLGKGEWSYSINEKGLSISPSILARSGCKSHYIITNSIANFV